MKHAMLKRKSLGKISVYLRQFGSAHGGQSAERSETRQTTNLPSSTKKGKGNHILRIRSRKQLNKTS